MSGNTYASLEVGDFYTKLVIGFCRDEKVNILFAKKVYTKGVINGEVINKAEVLGTITSLFDKAEKEGLSVDEVVLVLPNKTLNIYRKKAEMNLVNNAVSEKAINDIRNGLQTYRIPENYTCISFQELCYYLDGKRFGPQPPLNYNAQVLTLDSFVGIAKTNIHQGLIEILRERNIGLKGIVINSVASSIVALTEEERMRGAFIIDIGATSNSISFYKDGFFSEFKEGKLGGNYISKNLAMSLDIDNSEAEKVKMYYGACDTRFASNIDLYTSRSGSKYTEFQIVDVISNSVDNIINEIKHNLEDFTSNRGVNYPIVLVGGTSNLFNLDKKMKLALNREVIIRPKTTFGARNNVYTPLVGALIYAARNLK